MALSVLSVGRDFYVRSIAKAVVSLAFRLIFNYPIDLHTGATDY